MDLNFDFVNSIVSRMWDIRAISDLSFQVQNRTYSQLAFFNSADGKRYVLKSAIYKPNIEKFSLTKKHFNFPDYQISKSGQFEVFEDGFFYELYPFLEGESFAGSLESFEDVGKALSEFHDEGSFTVETDVTTFFQRSEEKYHLWQKTLAELNLLHRFKPLEKLVRSGDFKLSTGLCHLDWTPSNLLFLNSKVVAVLDLETLNPSFKARDFALSWFKTCRFNLNNLTADEGLRIFLERSRIFCHGYRTKGEGPFQSEVIFNFLFNEIKLKIHFILTMHSRSPNLRMINELENQAIQLDELIFLKESIGELDL